jgi:hypothetical protein
MFCNVRNLLPFKVGTRYAEEPHLKAIHNENQDRTRQDYP